MQGMKLATMAERAEPACFTDLHVQLQGPLITWYWAIELRGGGGPQC
jgi:hypothetical protein